MKSTRESAYPMRVVTRMTGLTSDTIRAWERRHGAIRPERSDGNTRRFSENDVRRLTLLKRATNEGHPISAVAQMTTAALEQLVERPAGVETYLDSIGRFDVRRARDILRKLTASWTPRARIMGVIGRLVAAFLDRRAQGVLSSAHEQLTCSQLAALCGALPPPRPDSPRVAIATPPGQQHELGLRATQLICESHGHEVVYLGLGLPTAEVENAILTSAAQILVTPLAGDDDTLEPWLTHLKTRAAVWLVDPSNQSAHPQTPGVRVFRDYLELDDALHDMTFALRPPTASPPPA